MYSRFFNPLHMLLPAVILSVFCGCGSRDSWQAKTYPVIGTAKINGENPEYAIVMLRSTSEPIDQRHSQPWAFVKSDGTYELMTYKEGDGAPEGEYAVVFYWPAHTFGDAPDRLGGLYKEFENPYMTVKITPGKNVLPPIELANVKVAPPARSPF